MPKAKYVDPGLPNGPAMSMKKWQATHGVNTNDLIMSAPAFHRLKASIPAVNLQKRGGGNRRHMEDLELREGQYDAFKRDGHYTNYWENNSRWDHHEEGFTIRRDMGDYYIDTDYKRYADRSSLLGGWTVTSGASIYRVEKPSAVSTYVAPRPSSPPRTRADQRPSWTEAPAAQQYGTAPPVRLDLPDVPGATYPPQASAAPVRSYPSKSRNSAPFSYAPFRGFNQPRKPAAKRGARSLRYSELYSYERKCVRDKLGGWAAFKLLPYSQQISALRACTRSSRY